MIRRLPLGPGSQLPGWLEALEAEAFGASWGPLTDQETLWAEEGKAFARWSFVPATGEAELLRIAVAPSARRRGLARGLLQAGEAGLAATGIQWLRLEVRSSNAAARVLYEAEGWTLEGTRLRYYRDGEDAALYVKWVGTESQ
ncbi:MAG: GNAT family N-acetyltransferase [Acidobacteria bacterium]|nr:GNAT family N-acetyltransferase [Acidobacteriota bacterium]